jgi:hypothetical protein
MAGVGRISVLVSRDLQTVLSVARDLPREVAAQVRRFTRAEAEPIFRDEIRGRVETRLQARALLDTARVSVTDSNVTLRSATIGRVSSGVPAGTVAGLAEFGNHPGTKITQRSRNGTRYTRRMGPISRVPRRAGYVFFPSVRGSIPRVASLWIQTAYRTVAEQFEKGAR